MKKNTKYVALLALLGAFVTPMAFGVWPFTKMAKWKSEVKKRYNAGQIHDLTIEYRSLLEKGSPTSEDNAKIAYLEEKLDIQ